MCLRLQRGGLGAMKVQGLFRNAQEITEYPAGSIIFNVGDAGNVMYGVVSGSVELHRNGHVVGTVAPEEVFGEMAIIEHSPRTATAIAATDCVLASIDSKRFLLLTEAAMASLRGSRKFRP